MHNKTTLQFLGLAAAAATVLAVAGCASLPSPEQLDAQATAAVLASFREQGIAKTDRVKQDLGQSACSSDKPPSDALARQIMAQALATVKWPAGGQYLGDWREGEKIAQNGRGFTWTDTSAAAGSGGGSCYNCHQIGKAEISFGNIGPSLHNYGKNRGVSDVTAPTAAPIVQYTWTKIYNSRSFSACSQMPRFGHGGLMTEDQIRHVMALLLDPKSPVNQ
ncbi:MAG: sulfur oxidation c-type cytochrome SoxX [Burkholderiales bacterium]|nr:sulfur oxidation c-type cytochrome SoxX [Burkholderiales bacterium]